MTCFGPDGHWRLIGERRSTVRPLRRPTTDRSARRRSGLFRLITILVLRRVEIQLMVEIVGDDLGGSGCHDLYCLMATDALEVTCFYYSSSSRGRAVSPPIKVNTLMVQSWLTVVVVKVLWYCSLCQRAMCNSSTHSGLH